ncbi:MAG: delta-60 repeat domain-containing protein [Solidesulfovibrio sp. DCME]|uniref:delta-60 repeat domain-containing protein n=1 Tax=Solidesulfovibrio sp. DCME TaxID=3447380 RepID=UPI003D138EA6
MIAGSARAATQAGALDTTFDPGLGAEKKPVIRGLLQDASTTFIVFGSFATVGGAAYANVVRLQADGTVDTTFTPPNFNGEVRAMAQRSDGSLLAGGNFTISGSPYYYDLALLSADGVLNTTFWSAFAGQGTINALAVQSDDKVLCGGYALQLSQVSVDPTRHLVRIQKNGFADGTYPVFNGPRAYVTGLAVDSKLPAYSDRLTVNGASNPGTTTQIDWLATRDNAGAALTELPDGSDTDGPVLAVVTAANDKRYVAGNFTKAHGHAANRLLRLNADNSLDTGFQIGSGPNGDITAVHRLADDSLVVVGAFTAFAGVACNRIVRLTANGAVDPGFTVGSGADAPILSVGGLLDGSLYLTGAFTTLQGQARNGLAAIAQDGTLLTAFAAFSPAVSASAKVVVYDLLAQRDGKIVVGGDFNWFGGVFAPNLARLLSTGAVDTTFSAGLGPDGPVNDVALASDGSLYAGGDIGGVATRPLGGLARFAANGAVDKTFTPIVTRSDNSPAPVYALLPQNDGKVLAGGHVRKVAGADRYPLARLNADGSLDTAFDPQISITNGTSLSTYALAAWQGKYYVGGYVTYDGLARGFFTRLTDTGALDTAFAPTTPSANVVLVTGTVLEMALQGDDKPVICGEFGEIIDGSWSRPTRYGLARFTTTGGLESFNTGMGAQSLTYVDSLSIEPNGGILFAGGFTKYNDVNRARLARALQSGALDTAFDPGAGVPARARVIRRVTPTRGLIGGEFATYGGVARSRLAGFVLDRQPPPGTAALILLLED